mgnify:CR=1 FL=1
MGWEWQLKAAMEAKSLSRCKEEGVVIETDKFISGDVLRCSQDKVSALLLSSLVLNYQANFRNT